MPAKDNRHITNENEAGAAFSTGTDVKPGTRIRKKAAQDTSKGKQPVAEKTEKAIRGAKEGETNPMTAIKLLEKEHSNLVEFLQNKVVKPIKELSCDIDALKQTSEKTHNALQDLENRIALLERTEGTTSDPEQGSEVDLGASGLQEPKTGPDKSVELNSEGAVKWSALKDREPARAKPGLNIGELIAPAEKKRKKDLDEDKKIVETHLRHARYWEAKGKALRSEIEKLENRAIRIIDRSKGILETLPSGLKDDLQNSQEGLSIVGRMLKRLLDPGDRLNELTEDILFTGAWKELKEDEWEKLLENETTEDSALRAINKQLKDTARENYEIVSGLNGMAEKRQKACLSFFQRQVLPILDGVNDGKRHLIKRIGELKQEHPEKVSELDDWFKAYGGLKDELTKLLEKVGVYGMVIEPGTKIDFERHEPFGVESEPEMEDEQIKEIIREGYEYTTQDGNRQILRAAQVVVVKNKS